MKTWKDNVYFVLVEPKEAGNVGASARAIKNMGFKNLCLVNPPSLVSGEARWFARNAHDILDSAEIFPTIKDAISGKSIVVGTSRRTGRKRGIFVHAEQGALRLFEIASANKVAILFGREDRGLYNEEIEECGFLMTIPSSKIQPSLNLAHAVLIIAYELSKAAYSTEVAVPMPKLVSQKKLLPLFEKIEEGLTELGYIRQSDRDLRNKIIQNLKHFIGRAGLTDWELKMFHGICSRIEKKMSAE
ncbi:MAG: RNA methyltransferase [Nitrospiraceae bacterium]|nr:MAG: RNA methyltransferase [Nitrospiraceae bacterium]